VCRQSTADVAKFRRPMIAGQRRLYLDLRADLRDLHGGDNDEINHQCKTIGSSVAAGGVKSLFSN
jgi:hypothetical protein